MINKDKRRKICVFCCIMFVDDFGFIGCGFVSVIVSSMSGEWENEEKLVFFFVVV